MSALDRDSRVPEVSVNSPPEREVSALMLLHVTVRLAILFALVCPVLHAQAPAGPKTQLIEISGAIEETVRLDETQLAALPRQTVTVMLTEGRTVSFEGTTLGAILQAAGVRMGDSLKGDRLAGFVLVEGADGFRAVFSFPELDSTFTDEPVLLAMRRDGSALSATDGPFRVIVPKEKKQSRWIRQVVAIRVLRAEDAIEE